EVFPEEEGGGGVLRDVYNVYQWSPNGQYLSYIADQEEDEVFDAYIVNLENKEVTKPAPDMIPGKSIYNLSWSPDSKYLSYASNINGSYYQTYLFDLASGERSQISIKNPSCQWSEDSQKIAYLSDQGNYNYTYNLYNFDLTKEELTKENPDIAPPKTITYFSWSSNNQYLAYLSNQDQEESYEAYLINLDPNSEEEGEEPSLQKINPDLAKGSHVSSLIWSPDGQRLVYRADQEVPSQQDLYLFDLASQELINISQDLNEDEEVDPSYLWSLDGREILFMTNTERLLMYQLEQKSSLQLAPSFEGSIHLSSLKFAPVLEETESAGETTE
ncbi:MAG: PD40 domain-containing protein, partial [Deltaproteobacteria bacterium]|nr:PD40 domain-containing protein [Deltaproteobacteria bacterium]